MPGGLMQLKAKGNAHIILTGNPTKTFFKSTYLKHTDFALQKFRVDFNGARTLRLTEESKMTFKIPRHADLLMDAYISVNMPNIWSPIMPPESNNSDPTLNTGLWVPYEYKWIEHLGAMMISNISITCGNYTIQEYSGEYMLSMVQRDFPKDNNIVLKGISNKINRAYVLGNGTILKENLLCKVYWNKYPGISYIKIPNEVVDPFYTVIAVVLDGPISLFKEKSTPIELN